MSRSLRPRKVVPIYCEKPAENVVLEVVPMSLRKRKSSTNYYPIDVTNLTPDNSDESDPGSDYQVESDSEGSDKEAKMKTSRKKLKEDHEEEQEKGVKHTEYETSIQQKIQDDTESPKSLKDSDHES